MKLRLLAAAAAASSFAAPSLAAVPGARVYASPALERLAAPATLPLPVRKGGRAGTVQVAPGGNVIPAEPLVGSGPLSHPGFGGRLSFAAGRTVHHAWSLT